MPRAVGMISENEVKGLRRRIVIARLERLLT